MSILKLLGTGIKQAVKKAPKKRAVASTGKKVQGRDYADPVEKLKAAGTSVEKMPAPVIPQSAANVKKLEDKIAIIDTLESKIKAIPVAKRSEAQKTELSDLMKKSAAYRAELLLLKDKKFPIEELTDIDDLPKMLKREAM